MSYPAEAFQRGLYKLLTEDTTLKKEMGGRSRAYDRVPHDHVFPYVTIPECQFTDDGDTCEDDRFEVFSVIEVWSRATGNTEAKRIAGAVRNAILNGPFSVTGWRLVVKHVTSIDHLRDPDGLTERARVQSRFIIEPV